MLISFMGGKLVGGDRGGVAGTIGTIGLIIGADIPMFLGAMIMGPLSAWVIKKFDEFIEDKDVKLVGAEAGGLGVETGKHASAMALGKMGVLHGMKTYLLQDDDGNIELAHSISAGLDYPGVGPEHAYLRDTGRVEYVSITDKEAMDALLELSRLEGIIPAIESAHALAQVIKMAKNMTKDQIIIMCLSGRGDKDVITVQKYLNGEDTNK